MSLLAVDRDTVNPAITSMSDSSVRIKNVAEPISRRTMNSIRKITNTTNDSRWSISAWKFVRVDLSISIYKIQIPAIIKKIFQVICSVAFEEMKNDATTESGI